MVKAPHAGIIAAILFLGFVTSARADVTLSGTQVRGEGRDAQLRCSGVKLPKGGVIVAASDSGAGFWLEGSGGEVIRFASSRQARGVSLRNGTWYAYPNLPPRANSASVSVTIRTGTATDASGDTGGTSSIRPAAYEGTYRNDTGGSGASKLIISYVGDCEIRGSWDGLGFKATRSGTEADFRLLNVLDGGVRKDYTVHIKFSPDGKTAEFTYSAQESGGGGRHYNGAAEYTRR
ncbi:MAG: hypothetical protein HYU64_00005 [Armatimonadetes bacterium]|nr:hypothetical protein [Armatimonadota bacterium]